MTSANMIAKANSYCHNHSSQWCLSMISAPAIPNIQHYDEQGRLARRQHAALQADTHPSGMEDWMRRGRAKQHTAVITPGLLVTQASKCRAALMQAYGNLKSYIDLLACLNVVFGWHVTWQTWRQKRLKPSIVVTGSQHMALTLPRTKSVKAGAMK